MMFVKESLQILSTRLPELEWKLSTLKVPLNTKTIPRGLFHNRLEMTPQYCIDEIKADLALLKGRPNTGSTRYLAERIHQKINILVRLCQLRENKKMPEYAPDFGVKAMSTRQQWLQTLHQDILKLTTQQQAMMSTLEQLKNNGDIQALLNLQSELGEVERRLTLANETFARATA